MSGCLCASSPPVVTATLCILATVLVCRKTEIDRSTSHFKLVTVDFGSGNDNSLC